MPGTRAFSGVPSMAAALVTPTPSASTMSALASAERSAASFFAAITISGLGVQA